MAKKFLTGLTLVNLDSDPLTGSEGELYFNTSASVAKIYKAGAWTEIGGGTGLSSIGSTPPLSPETGQTWFNDSNGSFYIYDGEFWVEITSTVSLTQEEVQDYAAPLLNHSNHTNISASYDDLNNQILLSASASFTTEEIQDAIAPLFEHSNHTNVAVSYDDLNNKILISASPSYTDENAMDAVSTMITNGTHTNISVSYDDLANTLSFTAAPGYTNEEAQDAASTLFIHNNHSNISASYDDLNNQIILSASASGTGVTISETAPLSASVGDLWYQASTGSFAVWDGAYWVEVNGVIENDPVTQEQIQDYVAPLLDHSNHVNISASYVDGSNQIILTAGASGTGVTISETAPSSPSIGDGWYNNVSGSFYLYDGAYWVEVNGIVNGASQDQVQDYAASLFTHSNHTNLTATYDDLNNQVLLTVGAAYTNEEAVDAVASALLNASANSNVVVTYDDVNNAINLNTSGSITNIDSIVYPDYIVFDTTPETSSASVGTLAWDTGESNLSLQLTADSNIGIGQELIVLCRNGEATQLNKGEVVRLAGAQGQRPKVMRAYNTDDNGSALTIGIVNENIAAGEEGFVVTQGIVRNINTNGFNEGDTLYLSSSAGVLTNIKPSAPEHMLVVGVVAKKNASSGRIYVKPINGFELDELHNVSISASVQNNDLLAYESSSGLWKNQTPLYATKVSPVITGTTSIQEILESATISASAATGTINYDLLNNHAVTYYTSNATGNFGVNIRGNSSNTLNSIMSTGQSLTIAFLITNGGTAYYQNEFFIDGTSRSVKWQNGMAPSSGNTNSIDIYTYTIIKTANDTFTVLASQSKFA